MNRSTNIATNKGVTFKKLYNLRKQQKIYMAFGLVMISNTQQKSQITKLEYKLFLILNFTILYIDRVKDLIPENQKTLC